MCMYILIYQLVTFNYYSNVNPIYNVSRIVIQYNYERINGIHLESVTVH